MAEILSAETLKATKVGNIEEAKKIIKKLIAAEKDQTKTSKPNNAKLKKWQTAITAYDQTETKARALHKKITESHPDLLNGKDVLNVTINEMQAALAKLDPEKRNAILNGSGIDEIQDVKLGNDLFEKGGALSNLGGDFLKGGDKSVAVSKAFTGVAIASFAASGVASVFKAATGKALTGALLKDGAMTALKFLGEKVLLPIWNFNPVGTALIAAVLAMKVIPVIARFVNKIKNKYASLTRANTMKNKLAELAEQDGPNVEFENSEFKQGNGEPGKGGSTYTPGGSSLKDPIQPGGSNTGKPQSLRQRMAGKPVKEQTAMFKNASLEEQIGYARESLEQCETELIGIEKNVNEFVAQYKQTADSKIKNGLETALATSAGQAKNIASELEGTLGIITTLLTNNPDNAELQELQKTASAKVETLRAKAATIQTACKKKEPIQVEEENTADDKKNKKLTSTNGKGHEKEIEAENSVPDFLPPGSQQKLEEARDAYKKAYSELERLLKSADGEVLPKKIIVEHDGIQEDMGYGTGIKEDNSPKSLLEIDADVQKVKAKKAHLDAEIARLKEEIEKARENMDKALVMANGLVPPEQLKALGENLSTIIDNNNKLTDARIKEIESSFNSYMEEANQNLDDAKADHALNYFVDKFEKYATELEILLSQENPDPNKLIKAEKFLSSAYQGVKKRATTEIEGSFGGRIGGGTQENLDPDKLAEINSRYKNLTEKSNGIVNAHLSETKYNEGVEKINTYMSTFDAAVNAKDKVQALVSLKNAKAEYEALKEIVDKNPKFKSAYEKLGTEISAKDAVCKDEKTFQTTAQKFPAARQFIQKFVYANGFGNNTHVLNNLEEAVSKIGSPSCATELRGVMKGSEEEEFLKEFVKTLRTQEKEGKGLEGSRDPAARKALKEQGLEEADIESIIGKGK